MKYCFDIDTNVHACTKDMQERFSNTVCCNCLREYDTERLVTFVEMGQGSIYDLIWWHADHGDAFKKKS